MGGIALESPRSKYGLIFWSVSAITLVVVASFIVSETTSTGTPDPCGDALRSIAEHKQNYERILQNGASPEDIRIHGSEEGALAHYKGNGEQMQRSYDKHCT